jgi:outer membrane lipoprotein carrier protein
MSSRHRRGCSAGIVAGVLLLVTLRRGVAAPQVPPAAADLARQIQAHYDTVRDFTADFAQTYRGGALRQTFDERGSVRVRKPGRMNWVYTTNDKNEIVSDGSKIYSYMKADAIVYVSDMPAADQSSTAILFLAGQGDLQRDFRASVPETQPDGLWRLDLVPKTPQADFTALTLTVDRRSFALRGFAFTDQQEGRSTFVFTNLRENVGLADNVFVFRIPRGVEVRR